LKITHVSSIKMDAFWIKFTSKVFLVCVQKGLFRLFESCLFCCVWLKRHCKN